MKRHWISSCSLLPKKKAVKEYALVFCEEKLNLILVLAILSTLVALIIRIAQLIVCLFSSELYRNQIIYLISILTRLAIYAYFLLLGKCSKKIQAMAVTILPFIYSVIITESAILTNDTLNIYIQILAAHCIFFVSLQYTMLNYITAVIPFVCSLGYPFFRVMCKSYITI
jgi:hypothetical protein